MKIFFLFLSLIISGCSPIIVTGGITTGAIYVFYQQSKQGGIKEHFKDILLRNEILDIWKESDLDEPFLRVVSVFETPVIIGAAIRKEALEKAKALAFVKSDRIECLADGIKLGSWNNELALSILMQLMIDFSIAARNYHIYAIRNQVFIVGVASSEMEKRSIITKVENMNSVEILRHYIIVRDEANGYVLHKE